MIRSGKLLQWMDGGFGLFFFLPVLVLGGCMALLGTGDSRLKTCMCVLVMTGIVWASQR